MGMNTSRVETSNHPRVRVTVEVEFYWPIASAPDPTQPASVDTETEAHAISVVTDAITAGLDPTHTVGLEVTVTPVKVEMVTP